MGSGVEAILLMAKLSLQNHGAKKKATDEFMKEVTSMKAYKDIMKGAPRCANIRPECTTFQPTDPLPNTTPMSPMPTAQTTTQSYNESGSQSIWKLEKVLVRSGADRERRHQKEQPPPT